MVRGFEDREIDEIMGWQTGKSAIQNRWMTPNEVRAREELDPLPGGDAPVSLRSPVRTEDDT
jgi:hypothetical protein